MSEERLEYDVVIVGGGPAGLAAAIRLKQHDSSTSVCVIEKGAEIGSHILSGAVLEPEALTELLPHWKDDGAPVNVKVTHDTFSFLTESSSFNVPHWVLPRELTHDNHFIISLGTLCRWLGEQAEGLGIDIFSSTTAAEILLENNIVIGIKTGDLGINNQGQAKNHHVPGTPIHANYTLIAEGARGFLAEKIIQHFQLRAPEQYQTYGLGIKELWEIDPSQHQQGLVQHTAGWPLDHRTYGGAFLYHLDNNKLAFGFVTALDYQNPSLNPFAECQRVKLHPTIKPLFQGGRRLCYGARALNEGGYSSLPQLSFPGGSLIGCSAGLLNVAKIKGIHNALRSGMLAADAIQQAPHPYDLAHFDKMFKRSAICNELKRTRNFRHYFRFGLVTGTLLAGLDLKVFRGHLPFTLKAQQPDNRSLLKTFNNNAILYPEADGKVTFNRLESLYLANITHDEDQPCHLHISDQDKFLNVSLSFSPSPEKSYCPALVYEHVIDNNTPPKLTINAANCLHCKACDIKDPSQTLHWQLPEGGSGPNYTEM